METYAYDLRALPSPDENLISGDFKEPGGMKTRGIFGAAEEGKYTLGDDNKPESTAFSPSRAASAGDYYAVEVL